MNWIVLTILVALGVIFFILERLGVPTTLSLEFKGDIKRESRWFAQYGQSMCTPIAALLVGTLDPHAQLKPFVVLAAVIATSITCMILKRSLGRVRPGRDDAGKFLGPTWKHANYRESFPSSHSACAVALSTALVFYYPAGWLTFWGLAFICAALRYLLDAHWPSDVLGGTAIGYAIAHAVIAMFPFYS
jgi:membrane-associated phospholipid phosphatase